MLGKLENSQAIALFGSLSSVIALVLTLIQQFFPTVILSNILPYIPYAVYILLLAIIFFFYREDRLLRSLVHDGAKLTYNSVRVTVDIERQLYMFSFEKHFEIISNNHPAWFKRQFYCNRYLDNDEKTRQYYAENTPTWASLHVFANMKYRRRGEKNFSRPIKLKVVPMTDNSYYIPFHIHYKNPQIGDYILLGKGTQVILNYGYQVSAHLWGSYLNRSLSFFGEPAHVIFQYPTVDSDPIEVNLYKLTLPDNKPEKIKECEVTSLNNNQTIYEIELPQESNGKYRIWWDSQELLGIQSTVNAADESKVTDY